MLLCIESVVIALFLIAFIVVGELASKWHKAYQELNYNVKGKQSEVVDEANAEQKPDDEPEGYVSGSDRFLDNLSKEDRAEFYKNFINGSCCGLKYKVGGENSDFYSGVFIHLSGVRFAISDSLMYKICKEYDRQRTMPVAAENK